ncbi:unnamed protein product, partial [Linum tenue]
MADLEGGAIFKGKTFLGNVNGRQQVNGGNGKRNGNQGAADGKKKRPRKKGKD